MSQKTIKLIGEGGAHLHELETSSKTAIDGLHKHLFFIGDRILMKIVGFVETFVNGVAGA